MVLLHAQYVAKSSYIIHSQYINYHVVKELSIIVVTLAGGRQEEINEEGRYVNAGINRDKRLVFYIWMRS